MTTWYRHRGDTGDTIQPNLIGGVADLSAATAVSATVTDCNGTAVTLTGTVLDPGPDKLVSIALASWITTAPPDTYTVQTHVDFGPGLRITWPAAPDKDKLVVLP